MSLVEVLKNFKERPEETVVAYVDESGQTKERYFVIGSTYFIPKEASRTESVIENFEKHLEEIKTQAAKAEKERIAQAKKAEKERIAQAEQLAQREAQLKQAQEKIFK